MLMSRPLTRYHIVECLPPSSRADMKSRRACVISRQKTARIPGGCPTPPAQRNPAYQGKEDGDPRAGEETCTTTLRRSRAKQTSGQCYERRRRNLFSKKKFSLGSCLKNFNRDHDPASTSDPEQGHLAADPRSFPALSKLYHSLPLSSVADSSPGP